MTQDPPSRFRWTFERWVAVANVCALLVGATLAAVDWWPQHRSHVMAADAAAETPTVPSSILTITDVRTYPADGSHLYDVVYSVATRNTASRPVTISYSIAELYVGVPRRDVSLGLRQGYGLEEPPTPWDAAGPGAIAWTRVYYDASWVDDGPPAAVKAFFAAHGLKNTSDGGGLTGALAPGDSTGTRPEFFVRAMPGDYIGVVVSYGLGDAVKSPSSNINLTEDYQRAPSTPAPLFATMKRP